MTDFDIEPVSYPTTFDEAHTALNTALWVMECFTLENTADDRVDLVKQIACMVGLAVEALDCAAENRPADACLAVARGERDKFEVLGRPPRPGVRP